MYVHFKHMSLLGNSSSLKQSVTGLRKTLCQSVFTLETLISNPINPKFIDEKWVTLEQLFTLQFPFLSSLKFVHLERQNIASNMAKRWWLKD